MTYQIGPIILRKYSDELFSVQNSARGDFNSVKFTYAELLRFRSLVDAALADHQPAAPVSRESVSDTHSAALEASHE